jgi:hypothetical protein
MCPESARATATFDDIATSTPLIAQIQNGGFTFSTSSLQLVTNSTLFKGSNDSNFLIFYSSVTPLGWESFAPTSASQLFNLNSIDIAGYQTFGETSRVMNITGITYQGKTVTQSLNVEPFAFTTFTLNGFSNLKSVQLSLASSTDYLYVAVDNINATFVPSPVPEPETYALLLAGLGLVGSVARRRAQRS